MRELSDSISSPQALTGLLSYPGGRLIIGATTDGHGLTKGSGREGDTMTEGTLTRKCGCVVSTLYLGRGKARLKRIAALEGSWCKSCMVRRNALLMTRINGDRYTEAEQADYIRRHLGK